ncbi:hypothetical protein [Desulfonatronospira thiodismutans]|uniref:hypothetical protein n=1 Tax=Desulfonatronospira thiodismutans TaxID=488939 RepID=UPI00019754DE|nr:hypothetical protein [Desulfonatronospira thiodismutans]
MFTDRVCPDLILAERPGVAKGALIHELQACYVHYHEKTGALRMLWNALTGKTPWTDPDYEVGKGCKSGA